MMTLIQQIDMFCKAHAMPDTVFGLKAMRDKSFVRTLRDGRDVKQSTVERLSRFMMEYREDEAPAQP